MPMLTSAKGQNRRYEIRLVNDRFLIRKRTFCATASNDGTWHYDERLKGWIRKFGVNTMIGTYNIGLKSAFQIPGMIFVRHYDPDSQIFTFVNDDFDLDALSVDVKRTKSVADKWVKDMESGVITLPFG